MIDNRMKQMYELMLAKSKERLARYVLAEDKEGVKITASHIKDIESILQDTADSGVYY